MNQEEYHPRDPRNPFTISKFIQERNISLKKVEITRLLAIDSLPLEIKKGLDEGYIDTHTVYELTKFSRDEQLNLYHYFRSFRRIPQAIRVEALKKYRDNRSQPFDIILIDEYRNCISSKYPIFGRLSDGQIADIAQNIDSSSLGKLAENLEYMISEGLKVEGLRLKHMESLASLSRDEFERYSGFKRVLKTKAEKLGMRFWRSCIWRMVEIYLRIT